MPSGTVVGRLMTSQGGFAGVHDAFDELCRTSLVDEPVPYTHSIRVLTELRDRCRDESVRDGVDYVVGLLTSRASHPSSMSR